MADTKLSAYGTTTTALSTGLNSLANNANSAASSAIDNTSDKHLYIDVELVLATQGSARSGNATVALYLTPSLDGTNYDDVHETTAELVGTFQLDAATTARRRTIRHVALSPGLYKLFVRNQTGQAFAGSGNTIRYRSFYIVTA